MKFIVMVCLSVWAILMGIVAIVSSYLIANKWQYGFIGAAALGIGALFAALATTFRDIPTN